MEPGTQVIVRLLPLLLIAVAAGLYFFSVQGSEAYVVRNTVPLFAMSVLGAVTLWRGGGRWTGCGWQWPLGTLGFALPALGLSVYIHYGFETDMHGMFSASVYPLEVFRFLPYYTSLSGAIGFAIGWIAGRNV